MRAEVEEGKEVKEVKEAVRKGPVRHFRDLLVYQQAYRLALEVSKLTRTFPKHEQFELGRQLRDCARSVAANIVEGWAKRVSAAEFKRHLIIAKGSGAEAEHWLSLAADEGFARRERCAELQQDYGRLGMMIHNLWKEWRKL